MASETILRATTPTLLRDMRETLVLAAPLIASQLAIFGQNLVDIVLAGHLGPEVLGAVAIGTSVWSLPVMAVVGLMMAVPPNVSQLDGGGRSGEVAGLFRQTVWLALAIGVVLGVGIWFAGPAIIGRMGLEAELARQSAAFVQAIAPELPALALFCACRGITDGLQRPRIGLGFGLLTLVLLAPLAWMLMYGRLGFAPMGAVGSAVATAIGGWVVALAYLAYVRFAPAMRQLGWGTGRRLPDIAALAALLRLGLPISISILLEIGLFSAVALLVGSFGALAIGSHQIALNVASASFMVPMGMSMAITVRVGNAIGRGDPAAARRAGLVGIALAGLASTVACTLFLTVPQGIAGLYTDDPALLAGAAALLFLAALFQLSDAIQVAAGGALRGMKDARLPMAITLLSYWGIGMPVGWFLAFPGNMGLVGMWIGLICGLSVAALLLTTRFILVSRHPAPATQRAATW